MDRAKIKTDFTNYFSIERGTNFREMQEKVSGIISNLYNSKSNMTSMTGWLNLPHDMKMFDDINSFVAKIKSEDKYEHLLVFGIGGSSLGAQALIEALNTPLWNRLSSGKRKGFLTIDFIDNLDPLVIRTILSRLKLDKTLFVVISKTGGTVETIVPMLIAKEWVSEDGKDFYKQCVFITSVETHGRVSLLFDL